MLDLPLTLTFTPTMDIAGLDSVPSWDKLDSSLPIITSNRGQD